MVPLYHPTKTITPPLWSEHFVNAYSKYTVDQANIELEQQGIWLENHEENGCRLHFYSERDYTFFLLKWNNNNPEFHG